MRKFTKWMVLSVLVLPLNTLAQLQFEHYDTTEFNNEIIVNGIGDYSASSIRKEISSKFIRGGVIDEAMKNASFDKHRNVNRAGGVAKGEVIYRNAHRVFKKKEWGMQFKAGYQAFGGLLYSKDFFGLTFYGNERYIGDTIDMSGMDMTLVEFQKIGFGFYSAKSKASVGFNVYNVSNRLSGDFRDVELVQSAAGDEIAISLDGELQMRNNKKFNQGIGFGVDLDFRLPVSWYKGRTAQIQFKAENIGFAYMYEDQKTYTMDTSFTYSGLKFSQLTGDNAIVLDSIDILDSLGVRSGTANPTIMLPGVLQVGKMVDRNSDYKLQSFFGARVYPTLIYSPFVYAGVDYRPKDWLNVGASVATGGFAGFKTGVYANLSWAKGQIGLGTDNLIGLVHKSGNGESIYIRLRCGF